MCHHQSQCAAKIEEPSSRGFQKRTTPPREMKHRGRAVGGTSRRPSRMMRGSTLLLLLCSLLLGDGVRAQTGTPTTPPTFLPTAFPTGAPFAVPTDVPTRAPTLAPTGAPFAATGAPSTQTPTTSPTGTPSSAPSTVAPTTAPSMGPSLPPIIGTRSPVVATDAPTASPTSAPTATPSAAPSLALQQFDFTALMQLEYLAGAMDSAQRIDWEVTTQAHIRSVLRELNYEEEVLGLNVATDVSVQTVLDAAAGDGRKLRRLEDSAPLKILQVEFVVRVTFRSAKTDYNVVNLVGEAFNTQAERNRYVQRLQATNPAFASVSSVSVLVDGKAPAPTETPSPEEGDDLMIFIIAGAGGGAALVTLGLCFLYCNRKGGTTAPKKDSHTTTGSDSSPAGLAADILVNPRNNDDISTLGDPVTTAMMTSHIAGPSDEHTASVHNDYDYSQEYRRAHGIASDVGSLDRNESVGNSASIFSSEHSLQELLDESNDRFEVVVPPGKLGIVMDNSPSSGTPMVYAVKPNSVLCREVRIGDRLISVDDADVTMMSAIQVSKLISLKNDQERTLVFVRKRESGLHADV